MPLYLLGDVRLYSDHEYCLSRTLSDAHQSENFEPLIFHSFWTGTLTRHHELSLKSILATQSAPFEIWVWMPPEDLERNHAFISGFAGTPSLRWKEYRLHEEARGTPLEGQTTLIGDGSPLALANAFRLLALEKYGGFYFDLDVLVLRNVRPLSTWDFCYQWSNQAYGNNAVLHAAKGSKNIWKLMERSAAIGTCRPRYLLAFHEIRDLMDDFVVLPVFLFDPIWIANDTGTTINSYCNQFRDFFFCEAPINLAGFFPGAYAYHWHNSWSTPIRQEALAGQLFEEINARLSSREANSAAAAHSAAFSQRPVRNAL